MDFEKHYEFREDLVESMIRDLAGPLESDPDEEIISDPPITRYIAGILFPRDAGKVDAHQDNETADDGDETTYEDPPVAMANVRYPSSMGMTFAVDTRHCSSITVTVTAAIYQPYIHEESGEERWRREVIRPPRCLLSMVPIENGRMALCDGLELFYRVRKPDPMGAAAVTVVLLNQKIRFESGRRDEQCFFQPRIQAFTPDLKMAVFVARPFMIPKGAEDDVLSNRLLYRHRAAIATGHGCSVEWEPDPSDSHRALTVSTSIIPKFEMQLADSNAEIGGDGLSMKRLAEQERGKVLRDLESLIAGYEQWIGSLQKQFATLETSLTQTAIKHVAACEESAQRMRAGLADLESKADVWEAFRLANRAMLKQRARTAWLRENKVSPAPIEGDGHRWRPFQIAFILLCIESISNPKSQHRGVADLLWFPTGGGKTEAYLGLIALTVFLRRLRNAGDADGVTVIMRYTLRLLTIQQFERAALLICCCEDIRRDARTLGNVPITIGLWVGRGGTPNTLKETRIALDKLRKGGDVTIEESNPMQLQSCPWCGTTLTASNYYITTQDPRLVISCRVSGCAFQGGVPAYVVDEDIYHKHPTVLIATVDKFASLPWREQTASIFNRDLVGVAPPELIIQDELHLISGPLGTLTGLYETAVDFLCHNEGIRPKVIASTATIRCAQSQTKGLFDRTVSQFPPPGLDARDSYFAVETGGKIKGTRLFVGLLAPAVSQTTLLVRTYAALLQNAATLPGNPEVRDSYWTLIGYFNSLRVLGGARMQVQDDVEERIALLATISGNRPRVIDNRIELTSREPSADIPSHLKRMANALPNTDTLDLILATNMISVGVDIDRLGLMAVMGQPQSTSEYIQATSRVGRTAPGLIFMLFNAARSRDRSHYESFVDYHSALYRQVESSSVTPFSTRARDRALHAVVIALARLMFPEFRANDSAARVAEHRDKLEVVKRAILERIEAVCPGELSAAALQIDQITDQWIKRAAQQSDLVFLDFRHPDRALLVDFANEEEHSDENFPTLWSLRDVDLSSNLYLVI